MTGGVQKGGVFASKRVCTNKLCMQATSYVGAMLRFSPFVFLSCRISVHEFLLGPGVGFFFFFWAQAVTGWDGRPAQEHVPAASLTSARNGSIGATSSRRLPSPNTDSESWRESEANMSTSLSQRLSRPVSDLTLAKSRAIRRLPDEAAS